MITESLWMASFPELPLPSKDWFLMWEKKNNSPAIKQAFAEIKAWHIRKNQIPDNLSVAKMLSARLRLITTGQIPLRATEQPNAEQYVEQYDKYTPDDLAWSQSWGKD